MIKVKNLKKSFNNKPILKGISCEFEKGKTSLIIGQTGSGKTVFLTGPKIRFLFDPQNAPKVVSK